jgi:hypothetical protein
MLLEWGNSSYYKDNITYISDNPHSLADSFLDGNIKYNNYYEKIKDKVKESCGNYNAIIGKVVNFNWKFNKDGTYDITLILRSLGDIIESLKSNTLLPGKIEVKEETNSPTPPEPTPENVIKSFKDTHEIGKELYRLQQILQPLGGFSNGMATAYLGEQGTDSYDVVAFRQNYQNGPTQYYVRLGYLLEFIQNKILPYVEKPEVPILKIDYNEKSNVIYLMARQLSTRPDVCIFNTSFNTPSGFLSFASKANTFRVSSPSESKNVYGYIMNSYFNMQWILTTMDSLKNNEGKVSLYDLLDSLCKGWNEVTGNFSKLGVTIDPDEGIIRFTDEVSLPDRDAWLKFFNKPTDLAKFNVYGFFGIDTQTPIASFIRDINFETTISPNLATMITIGSTQNGYVVGQDSTALANMNSGLEDRFKTTIETRNDTKTVGTSSINENYSSALDAFSVFMRDLGSWKDNAYPKWNQEAINNFTSTATNFYEYDQAKQTLEAVGLTSESASVAIQTNNLSSLPASPNTGFLPFNLSLTMDGLSGIKIYQKYIIDTTYLPSNYPTSLEFLVKGITDIVQNNEWITTLESIAIPKNPFGSSIGESAVASGTNRDENRGQTPSTTFSGNTPNADALRAVLVSLGYIEKNKELSSGGDITFETYKAASSVFKTIKEKLPSISINVTGGNDSFHKTLNYNSRHKLGKGVDFTINPATPSNISAIENILLGFSAGNNSFRFLNEYASPTKAATAKHFHMSWGAGTEGQSNVNKAKTLVNQNKITIYNIV